MGFMVEGSTGARAVAMLKAMPQGTIIETPDFAMALSVKPGALHQLLANAVKLRLIKKVRTRGSPCIGWALGAGNVGTTIEPRRAPAMPPSLEDLARRQLAEQRRQQRAAQQPPAPQFTYDTTWPPGFVSALASPELRYRAPSSMLAGEGPDADPEAVLPVWLRGLVPGAAPAPDIAAPSALPPRPQQLPLFDPSEIGEPGRERWRRLDLSLPKPSRPIPPPQWRQVSILEVCRLRRLKPRPTSFSG